MSHNDFFDFKLLQQTLIPKINFKKEKKFSELKKVHYSKSKDIKV